MGGGRSPVVDPAAEKAAVRNRRDNALLRGLTENERLLVVECARFERYGAGETLFHQGQSAECLYMVLSGRVKLLTCSEEGRETINRFLRAGDPFAAVAGLDEQAVYPVTARSIDPTHVLAWPRQQAMQLMKGIPRLAMNLMEVMASYMRENLSAHHEVATGRVPERLAAVILRLAAQAGREYRGGILLEDPVSRQDLAEMTGTTLYSVSRILSQWEEQGMVELGRRRILILQPDALKHRDI